MNAISVGFYMLGGLLQMIATLYLIDSENDDEKYKKFTEYFILAISCALIGIISEFLVELGL